MIVFYVILAGHFGYFSLLAVNALAFKKLKVAKSQGNENVAINPHITYLGNESASPRPNYKKKNLTIEIPDLAIEGEDTEVRFIKKYYKVKNYIGTVLPNDASIRKQYKNIEKRANYYMVYLAYM